MYICSIVPYSLMNSCQTRYDNKQRFGGKLGPKGLCRGGVYAMYSIEVALWLRREQGYLSAQASTEGTGRQVDFNCPSIVSSSLVETNYYFIE